MLSRASTDYLWNYYYQLFDQLPDQMLKSQAMCVPPKCAFPSVYKDMLPPFSTLPLRITGSFFLGEGKQAKSKNGSVLH